MVTLKNKSESVLIDSYEWPNNVTKVVPNPKVTIISLTFNKLPYIEQCIRGVLEQNNEYPFEYIIAEDYSTDGTREIVKEYAEKYPNIIRVITADYNMGIVKNQFRSVHHARGEYIAFCDADDYWTDHQKVKKQIAAMEIYQECNLSFHPVYLKTVGDDNMTIYKNHSSENQIFTVEDIITGGGDFCITSSIMIKRRILEDVNEWSMTWPVNDYHTQITGALAGGALYLNSPMAVYRKNITGSWTEKTSANIENKYSNILEVCKTNREFNKRTHYRHQKAFKKQEKKCLKLYFRPVYGYDRHSIQTISKLVKTKTSGLYKANCYRTLFLSFLYYKLQFRVVLRLIRKLQS